MKDLFFHRKLRLQVMSLLAAVASVLIPFAGLSHLRFVGAALLPPQPAVAVADRRPNIVVLMTDDQTVSDLAVMPKTRRLIGAAGVAFTNSFVSYPMCCPSRATYFSGQYAHNHGVLYNSGRNGGYDAFVHPETSFPNALQRAGYTTIHIGKFLNRFGDRGLQPPPGWDDFHGAFDPTTYNYYSFSLDVNGKVHTYPSTERNYRTDVYARLAAAAIRRAARSHQPYFLNVAFLAPHAAGPRQEAFGKTPAMVMHGIMDNRLAVAPRRYRGRLDGLPLPHPPTFDETDLSTKPAFMLAGRWQSAFRRFTSSDILDMTRRYRDRLESLMAVDDAVQRIIRTLHEAGQLKKTVVIFTSDNGFFNGEHRIRAGKYFVYDPATRVPLLVRGPGIAHGVSRSQLVGNIDLAPTILSLAHAEPLRIMDGRSLRPLLTPGAASASWDRPLLLETAPNSDYPAVYHAIRTEDYLYVEYSTGDRELYDLAADPDELHNRQGDPAFASIRAHLARRLASLETCRGASCR